MSLNYVERDMWYPATEEVNNKHLTEEKQNQSIETNEQDPDKTKESTNDAN